MADYSIKAILEKTAIIENNGIAHNAAIIEAVKILYPAEYADLVYICTSNGFKPETQIPDLIHSLQERAKSPVREGLYALEYIAALGIKITPCVKKDTGEYVFKYPYKNDYENLLKINPLAKISDTKYFTSDIETIRKHVKEGIENFKFIPADNGLLCIDIDAKEGKENGIKELLRVFDQDTLPIELKDIERNFPCYVKTPNNGYHLYFKYAGQPVKNTALFNGIETKHGSPGLTSAGSVKDGKPYILYGAIEDAPPLYGLILDKIKKRDNKTQTTADKKINYITRTQCITLDDLAAETSGGHHDRQVQFAGKVYRFQKAAKEKGRAYDNYTAAAALAYVKARTDIFGNGRDTENTILSVFKDNGGI